MTEAAVHQTIADLQSAWNAGDGAGVAETFAEEATMIDVRGRMLHGRTAIAEEHRHLFDTIFRGSTMTLEVLAIHDLGDGLTLAHTTSVVHIPTGPRAGDNRGIQTHVMRGGKTLAFQNTARAG